MHSERPATGAPAASQPFVEALAQGRCAGWRCAALAGGGEHETLEELLRRIFAARPRSALRSIPGRLTFAWPDDERVVVKRYRGGALGDALHDWRALGQARSAARREAENLRQLALCGLPVPRALGWCEERPVWRARPSAVWMERVEHSETLRQACERAPRESAARWLAVLAAHVARLHASGWYHRDLYLQHVVLRGEELVLLDVGRARHAGAVRPRWFEKALAALLHSTPRSVPPRERLRFLLRYLEARGIPERRAWLRAILRRAARMAAHQPRHGETRPWEDL